MERRGTITLAVAAIFLACLASLAGVASAASGSDGCTGRHWVGAWSASPTDADPGTSRSLAGMTVRNVLTPLGSGGKVRVRFTNVFTDAPVKISAATLARAGERAKLRGAPTALRFGGSRSISIPAGGEARSDPVAFDLRAFRRLAVSAFVDPGSDALATEHYLGRQTSYFASGDHTADRGSAAFGQTTRSRFLVAGLDVRAPRKAGAVATFGDSLTDGFQGVTTPATEDTTQIDLDARYPDYLAQGLAAKGKPANVLNAGISGNQLLGDPPFPRMGPSGLSRIRRDVLGLAGVRTAIVLIGINDIGLGGSDAPQLIAGLEQAVSRMQGAGLRVLLGTLTPAGGTVLPSYGGAAADATRQAVNAWIRSQKLSDGIVDFDAALRDEGDASRLAPAFDSSDHLHPGTAGYEAMARAVPLGALNASGCR